LSKAEEPRQLSRLAAMPEERGKKEDTIKIARNRLRMLFDVKATAEKLDGGLCGLLSALQTFSGPVEAQTLNDPAADAARLLKIQPQVERLLTLKASGSSAAPSDEDLKLQVALVKNILGASLQVRKAKDLMDDQLATEYTAQGEIVARRDRGINLNNNINFSQFGIFGVETSAISLKGMSKSANQQDLVTGGCTLLLSSIALMQLRGGHRRSDAAPNMLGQILGLEPPADQRFTPLIWSYLESVPPGSKDGKTRREHLIARWKKAGVITVGLDKRQTLEKLAVDGPAHQKSSETIKLITNRIVMLHDVCTLVESLDSELVDLLHAVD
jgi:hypothetical protein